MRLICLSLCLLLTGCTYSVTMSYTAGKTSSVEEVHTLSPILEPMPDTNP